MGRRIDVFCSSAIIPRCVARFRAETAETSYCPFPGLSPLLACHSEGCVLCSPKNLNPSFNLAQAWIEILRFAQDDNLNSFARAIEHIRLHAIERIGGVGKSPRRKLRFNQPQKRIALLIISKVERNASFVVRRSRRCGAEFAHVQPVQARQCRPSDLINHGPVISPTISCHSRRALIVW